MKHARLTTLVALVAWVGVLLQLALSLQLAMANGKSVGDGLVIYLGFFTVLTNLLVAISLSWPLLRPHSAPGRWLQRPGVNSAITVSIAIVGLAYHLLLRHIWNPQGLQWLADVTLHYAVPLLCLVHWWFAVPPARMAWSAPLAWAAWPLAYLAYALLRGVWLQSYPYPFIDVLALGYPQTLLNSAGLLVVFLLLGSVLVAISRARFRPPPP
ncbi:Pr6Pr family membrane protein [Hydrogenophaga sp.]|uniref:Pr6Pr family membrane protein n=1 Tax=Hydrogenophaga sp. TaxID=1904254 RepID=UPI00273072C6|nr:Pr6Pr family membrane protein [Hydrogenophaga sp.]MDP1684760.1 Pr6Pr family membrane protein [Hydrogenophaga sp.]